MDWVNSTQSKKERRKKYRVLKKAGLNVQMCQRARDWTDNHIEQLIKANGV